MFLSRNIFCRYYSSYRTDTLISNGDFKRMTLNRDFSNYMDFLCKAHSLISEVAYRYCCLYWVDKKVMRNFQNF
jgi:hypothetical protein